MVSRWIGAAFCAAVVMLCAPRPSYAEEADNAAPQALPLTLKDAYALARKSAPGVLSARARIREAKAERVEAGIFPRENPILEVALGPRIAGSDATPSASAQLSMTVDTGGGLSARLASADASFAMAQAGSDAEAQQLLRSVGFAFVRALWAEDRLTIAREIEAIAIETLRTSERRAAAGDIAKLELNVARVSVARAKSSLKSAEADRDANVGELHVLLGVPMDRPLSLQGRLGDTDRFDVASLLGRVKNRPDLVALAAELRQAKANLDLGDALAAPQLGLGVAYAYDETDVHTVMGILSFSLPFFDHGQGITASAAAKKRRVEVDQQQKAAQATIEVRSAFDVYQRRIQAVEALEDGGVASFDESLALAKKGYLAGEMSLTELLTLRREILEGKLEYLDRQLEARTAGIELQAAAGALP